MYGQLPKKKELCRHGEIVERCYVCDLQEEVEQLKAENRALAAENRRLGDRSRVAS